MFNLSNHQGNQNHNEIITSHLLGWLSLKTKIKSVDKDVEKLELLFMANRNVKWYSAMENSMEAPQRNIKENHHMTQQSHFWTYMWKNWNQDLEEIAAFPCSLQQYSQQPTYGNNLNVHWWMNKEMWYIHTIDYPNLKKKEILPVHNNTMKLRDVTLNEISWSQKITVWLIAWFHLYEVSKNLVKGFPCAPDDEESACNVGDLGSIPGSGRTPGEGNGYPLQYSCLENSMDRGYSPWGHKESDMTEWLTLSKQDSQTHRNTMISSKAAGRRGKWGMLFSGHNMSATQNE